MLLLLLLLLLLYCNKQFQWHPVTRFHFVLKNAVAILVSFNDVSRYVSTALIQQIAWLVHYPTVPVIFVFLQANAVKLYSVQTTQGF